MRPAGRKATKTKYTMSTEERTTRNRIARKLAATSALVCLYVSHQDERGLDLARTLEREAHALWVGLGYDDCPTWELVAIVSKL